MSLCRSEELDQLLRGELSAARAAELHAHLERCAACSHEVAWLRLEGELFARRASRSAPLASSAGPQFPLSPSEVEGRQIPLHLVRGERSLPVARRDSLSASPSMRERAGRVSRWRAAAAALAACAVLMAGGRFWSPEGEPARVSSVPVSRERAQSVDLIAALEHRYGACLVATPGPWGCGQLDN
ncbi:MAG: zf-HC2 domain-containing protein [Myxococcales bacterium]|nr:zf-HC2 domain-containing protein [Myxococcales bacterium]